MWQKNLAEVSRPRKAGPAGVQRAEGDPTVESGVYSLTRSKFSPLVWTTGLGMVAMWSIMLGTSMNSSPFTLHKPGSWFFSTGPGTSHGMLLSLVLVYGGLLLFLRVWLDLIHWLEDNPGYPLVRLIPIFALWVLPM
ncbi:MAG TPA: hypothetical protein VMU77_00030, partial [Acidimicrobiales bacterium]|nr:hypothetical protein [Acidimicrobiales bacterium]